MGGRPKLGFRLPSSPPSPPSPPLSTPFFDGPSCLPSAFTRLCACRTLRQLCRAGQEIGCSDTLAKGAETLCRTPPLQCIDFTEKSSICSKRGQFLEEQRKSAAFAEDASRKALDFAVSV